MKVLTEWETVKKIKDEKLSIARYGDGEFKLCIGHAAKSQKYNIQIAKKLREILKSDDPRLVVGIPRIYEKRDDWPTQKKAEFWKPFATLEKYTSLLKYDKTYVSSFITRPDSSGIETIEFYAAIKSFWQDRNVLLIKGHSAGFAKDQSIFDTARSWRVMPGPDRDAFDSYEKILYQGLSLSDENTVIVLSLGPTATVLAYAFTQYARQSLDLGHLGMFYAHIHPKQKVVCS